MYRALTLKALRKKVDLQSEDVLVELAQKTKIDLENEVDVVRVLLDGEDVSEEIRTVEVTNNTFYIARASKVREIMVSWQKEIGYRKSVVVEGRDVTTVVFPDAKFKFYLDADVNERSQRRYKELKEKGKDVLVQSVSKDLKDRDHKDFSRETGALKIAEDAIVIDSTYLSIEEVVQEILKHVNN